jgi:hypothetical protein
MSLPFSDTTTKGGIMQHIEKNCGFPDGGITGNAVRFLQFTSEVNLAHDDVLAEIFKASGFGWQPDDTNHSGFPSVTIPIVSGTKTYTFSLDAESSLILAIHKVLIRNSTTGQYIELKPVDRQSDPNMSEYNDGQTRSGVPSTYDKTGNRITFNITPDYNSSDGILLLIDREGTYFTVADTTKKPGIAGLFHEWYVLKPSYNYARINRKDNRNDLKRDMNEMLAKITSHYGSREKDVRGKITSSAKRTSFR